MQHPVRVGIALINNNVLDADLLIAFSWGRQAESSEDENVRKNAQDMCKKYLNWWLKRAKFARNN